MVFRDLGSNLVEENRRNGRTVRELDRRTGGRWALGASRYLLFVMLQFAEKKMSLLPCIDCVILYKVDSLHQFNPHYLALSQSRLQLDLNPGAVKLSVPPAAFVSVKPPHCLFVML